MKKPEKSEKTFEKSLDFKGQVWYYIWAAVWSEAENGANWSLKIEQQRNFESTEKCEGISLKNFEILITK